MRSATEIKFRLRQEAANLYLLWRRPTWSGVTPEHLNLPDGGAVAAALRDSAYAKRLEKLADSVLNHSFPILGIELETGDEIRWRRDYQHTKESGSEYFKRIPYLDFEAVGDHKLVWELNRHQHLVLLAQAYLLSGRQEFVQEISAQLRTWWSQNPFQRGINWASALEVAFRTLSWIWVYHLVAGQLEADVRNSLVSSLYQHGLHLASNLSVYFSPNTHLLGEAVALFVLATLFPQFPGASEWASRSECIVLEQLDFQVKPDGSHFEQSTYYHVYAVDFFLLFYVVSGCTQDVAPVLIRMAEYLSWILGPSREISFFGDDDGGRLFHPYGERSCFGRATLATCGILFGRSEWGGTAEDVAEQAAWWLGASAVPRARPLISGVRGSRAFEDSGSVFLEAGEFFLQMDCGPFGFGGAGHSHSDTLSLTLRFADEAVLVDPGTFTYISDVAERNWFRGSGAHNTVRVDNLDQADPVNPFRWSGKPTVGLSHFGKAREGWLVDGFCEYRGIRHRRRLLLNEQQLLVLDDITGADGEHVCEQIWQLGPKAADFHLATSAPNEMKASAFSPAYAKKVAGKSLVATARGALPVSMTAVFSLQERVGPSLEEIREIFDGILPVKRSHNAENGQTP